MVRSRTLRRTLNLRKFAGVLFSAAASLAPLLTTSPARGQEIILNVTYICSGERIYVYGCDIRDQSDAAWCSVGHPEKLKNGMDTYTSTTRGALKKLLPTCQQPSSQQVAKQKEFDQRLQAHRDTDEKKAYDQMHPPETATTMPGQRQMTPEQRRTNRCVTSGRLPATCTGNALMRGFDELTGHVLSTVAPVPSPGPEISGAFEGAGKWRIDFGDRGAAMRCSVLDPSSYTYAVQFRDNHAIVTLNTAPRPTVLTIRGDELAGAGPLTIDGHVIVGWTRGGSSGGSAGHYESQQVTTHQELTPLEAAPYAGQSGLSQNGQTYDMATTSTQSTYVPGSAPVASGPQPIYGPKRATCVAPALSSKNAGPSSTVAATGMLKALFSNGDSGPPVPPGVRMHGIFAASSGFSVEFFPESAILGCGPDAARAYPYTVIADGTRSAIEIDVPDHPLLLAIRSDGSLDPGSTAPYEVHGRTITGQDANDNFTFARFELTCDLAVLTPGKTIPANGGVAPAAHIAAATAPIPTGNSTLSITSGLPPQPNTPNPLANHPYVLLRTALDDIVRQSGVTVPPGLTPFKFFGVACASGTQDCQTMLASIKANVAAAARADSNGSATLPNLAVGTYYLMISTRFNNHGLIWTQSVPIKDGQNSITLDIYNATTVN